MSAPDGRLWLSGSVSNVLVRLAASRDAIDATLALPAGSLPYRIAIGPDGNLWATMASQARSRSRLAPDAGIRFAEAKADQLGRLQLDPPGSAAAPGGPGSRGDQAVVSDAVAPKFTQRSRSGRRGGVWVACA